MNQNTPDQTKDCPTCGSPTPEHMLYKGKEPRRCPDPFHGTGRTPDTGKHTVLPGGYCDICRGYPPYDDDHTPPPATGEALAERFHEAYERLAPKFGYKTREETAKSWENVPDNNKALMVAVCEELLGTLANADPYVSNENTTSTSMETDPLSERVRQTLHAMYLYTDDEKYHVAQILALIREERRAELEDLLDWNTENSVYSALSGEVEARIHQLNNEVNQIDKGGPENE